MSIDKKERDAIQIASISSGFVLMGCGASKEGAVETPTLSDDRQTEDTAARGHEEIQEAELPTTQRHLAPQVRLVNVQLANGNTRRMPSTPVINNKPAMVNVQLTQGRYKDPEGLLARGYGISFTKCSEGLRVDEFYNPGPAHSSELVCHGDILKEINGKSTRGQDINTISKHIAILQTCCFTSGEERGT